MSDTKLASMKSVRGTTSLRALSLATGIPEWRLDRAENGGVLALPDAQKVATALGSSLAACGSSGTQHG